MAIAWSGVKAGGLKTLLLLASPVYHNQVREIPAIPDLARQVRDSPATFGRKMSAGRGRDRLCFQAAGEKRAAQVEPILANRMRYSVADVPLRAMFGGGQSLG